MNLELSTLWVIVVSHPSYVLELITEKKTIRNHYVLHLFHKYLVSSYYIDSNGLDIIENTKQ